MTSYQRRLKEIAQLEQQNWELVKKSEFFQRAIWDARKATGERLGVEPFTDLWGNEEGPIITDSKGLIEIIRGLPLTYFGPGIEGNDFITGEEELGG